MCRCHSQKRERAKKKARARFCSSTMFSPLRESGASAKMYTSHAMKENQWHVIIRCEYVILNNRGARTNSSTGKKKITRSFRKWFNYIICEKPGTFNDKCKKEWIKSGEDSIISISESEQRFILQDRKPFSKLFLCR